LVIPAISLLRYTIQAVLNDCQALAFPLLKDKLPESRGIPHFSIAYQRKSFTLTHYWKHLLSPSNPEEDQMRLIFTVVLFFATCASAAPPPGGESPSGSQLFPRVMVRYSTPVKMSASLGITFMQLRGYNNYSGFFVQVEPGIAGGKLSTGYTVGRHQFIPIFNAGINASLLQTWGNPLQNVRRDQTYFGLEVFGAFSMIGVNAGVFRHVAGDDEENSWIYSLGIGCGI
jgi:hypothetical protein